MSFILQEKKGRLGIITLNRPDKRNALNSVVIEELREAFTEFEADEEVKVIILRASGTVFSAGADLHYLRFYGIIILALLFFQNRKWSYYWLTFGLVITLCCSFIYTNYQHNKLKQIIFYSVNRSWAIDFIAERRYQLIGDSLLLADSNKIGYHLSPYRLQNGLSYAMNNIEQTSVSELGEVMVWHDKRILLAPRACKL